ncbi:Cna B-type domain-containing protein, partial [Bacillus sp. JJ1127]|uniref:Cna B-type domain-containing protein n=1 Tax=Bacillus sp. JJ1127 TaxID=3122952 RepID=UPI002FFE696A
MNIHSKRVFSIFSIIMIFMFTIGQSLLPIIAKAQELNTTGFVDSFTIEKTKLQYGEQTKINVNFSDKSGNKMKAGDTLTLTLPPELVGFSGTIPLKNDEGTDFGTCQITTTNVVCTFTDVVEKLQNIRGHFNFTVSGMNVPTGETKTIETNLGTDLAKQAVTISGPTGSTEPTLFFYKSGDIQPSNTDEVRWFLAINNKKQQLNTDIVLSDSVQPGQTLNKNSFYIAINNGTTSLNLTLQQFQDQGYGTITFTGDNSFDVLIDKDKASGNSFTVGYTTAITESGKTQESFFNNYKINYQIVNEAPVSNENSTWVKNISMGGGAQGDLPPKGTLRIVKHIEGNPEKFIPNVTFKLYKESGEQIGDTYTTGAQGITEIPNLDPGNYYVQEIKAPVYVDFDPQTKISFTVDGNAEKGVKLMIPNKVKTTSVSGTKTWNDNNAIDRPKTIQVDLLRNGQKIDTKEVTAENGWNYTFANVPAYDNDGNAYTYTVKEKPVAGYKSEVNGYNITNTKEVKTTSVTGTKTWKDDNATDRPDKIQVDLLQNGQVINTQDVTEASGWNYTFADLAQYDANGVAYTYTVKEKPVAGYKSEVNGYNITNTKVAKLTVEGTKTWKDGNATDRPVMIKVDLLQNGNVIQTQDVLAVMGWKYIFADLETYDANGVAYQYEVKERPVAGYQSSVSGYDITNTKVGQTTVEGTKTWKDDNATDRPKTIKVDLLQNGQVINTQDVTATNGWKYEFKDLAAYDANGAAYKYEVKEQPVAGYKSEVNGYNITNTKEAKTTVEGTKTWKDDNATDRPKTIRVDLLQNGQVINTQDVTATNGWKYEFKDLAASDASGAAYKYEVKEQPVAGYQSEVNGYDITNTKIKDGTVVDPKPDPKP